MLHQRDWLYVSLDPFTTYVPRNSYSEARRQPFLAPEKLKASLNRSRATSIIGVMIIGIGLTWAVHAISYQLAYVLLFVTGLAIHLVWQRCETFWRRVFSHHVVRCEQFVSTGHMERLPAAFFSVWQYCLSKFWGRSVSNTEAFNVLQDAYLVEGVRLKELADMCAPQDDTMVHLLSIESAHTGVTELLDYLRPMAEGSEV